MSDEAQLRLVLNVNGNRMFLDMYPSEEFNDLHPDTQVKALGLIVKALDETTKEICEDEKFVNKALEDAKLWQEIDEAEQQAKADTCALFERVMGRPN